MCKARCSASYPCCHSYSRILSLHPLSRLNRSQAVMDRLVNRLTAGLVGTLCAIECPPRQARIRPGNAFSIGRRSRRRVESHRGSRASVTAGFFSGGRRSVERVEFAMRSRRGHFPSCRSRLSFGRGSAGQPVGNREGCRSSIQSPRAIENRETR